MNVHVVRSGEYRPANNEVILVFPVCNENQPVVSNELDEGIGGPAGSDPDVHPFEADGEKRRFLWNPDQLPMDYHRMDHRLVGLGWRFADMRLTLAHLSIDNNRRTFSLDGTVSSNE